MTASDKAIDRDGPFRNGEVGLSEISGHNELRVCSYHDRGSDDWCRHLLSGLDYKEVSAGSPPKVMPNTLYAVCTNSVNLQAIPGWFYEEVRRTPGVGLLHLSDEWFGEDYNCYRAFSFVLRMYYSRLLDRPGILNVPLGVIGFAPSRDIVPSSSRRFVWSYFGTLMASRPDMLAAFSSLFPSCSIDRRGHGRVTRPEFLEILGNSVFAPAPMGNVMLETWRLYEALEYGCIPIVERRISMDYFHDLLGDHPIPCFGSWRQARRFVEDLMNRPRDLDALQLEVASWWSLEKVRWRDRVAAFVRGGLRGDYRAAMESSRYPRGLARRFWQCSELMRHHSPSALRRRIARQCGRVVTRWRS